jgi:chaperonin GroES
MSKLKVTDSRPKYDSKPVPKPTAPNVKFEPIGSKVCLWREPDEEGLIAIADSAKEKPLQAIVIAVSSVGLNEFDSKALSSLKKGDRVLVRKHSGTEIKVDGFEVTVMHVQDILGKL